MHLFVQNQFNVRFYNFKRGFHTIKIDFEWLKPFFEVILNQSLLTLPKSLPLCRKYSLHTTFYGITESRFWIVYDTIKVDWSFLLNTKSYLYDEQWKFWFRILHFALCFSTFYKFCLVGWVIFLADSILSRLFMC